MKEKLLAVDWYKVTGLALLFWLCVCVNSLGDKVKDFDKTLSHSLWEVRLCIEKASKRTKTVEVRNPIEGNMYVPLTIRNK